jgi:hypothetical protein
VSKIILTEVPVPDPVSCLAFPEGIPEAVFNNKYDHRQAFKGDNGITFLPVSERANERQRENIARALAENDKEEDG